VRVLIRTTSKVNGKCHTSGSASTETLGSIFKKLYGWLHHGFHPTCKYWVSRLKGGVSAHAWNCHPPASIFSLFWVPCASLQVGPLDRSSPLTAQMTRSGGHYVLFMVPLINKKYFSRFVYPKMWKIALHPMGTLNSYNFGSANLTVQAKFVSDQPLLPW